MRPRRRSHRPRPVLGLLPGDVPPRGRRTRRRHHNRRRGLPTHRGETKIGPQRKIAAAHPMHPVQPVRRRVQRSCAGGHRGRRQVPSEASGPRG